jgi:hypothetical protein
LPSKEPEKTVRSSETPYGTTATGIPTYMGHAAVSTTTAPAGRKSTNGGRNKLGRKARDLETPLMPRRSKPPGMGKWTWDEINQGLRMSKSEKRGRRLAVALGATKDSNGRIQPPTFADNPTYYFVFVGLIAFAILMAFLNAR